MKEDKEKSLNNSDIKSNLIELNENNSYEKGSNDGVVEPELLNNGIKNCVLDSSSLRSKELRVSNENVQSMEEAQTISQALNETETKPNEKDPSGSKLALRPRKVEVFSNGNYEFELKNSKTGCPKTEKNCEINENETLPKDETSLICHGSMPLKQNSDLSIITIQHLNDLNNVNGITKERPEENLGSVDNASKLIAKHKIKERSIESLQFIKTADDISLLKNKENSESDTKMSSSSASEKSILRTSKKRRKRKEVWWTKKRKRSEKNNQKINPNATSVNKKSFHWREPGTDSSVLNKSVIFNSKKKGFENQENPKKAKEFAIPSPSIADINIKTAISKSTDVFNKVPKPNLCFCRKKPNVFISGNNNTGDLYCQALDCIDTRVVGCCNAIPSQDVGLFRASEKAAYQMMCNVHQERLLRHNCCPGCGLFCTQGKCLMCKSWHHFHRTCFINDTKNNALSCPHCGDTQLKAVIVSIHASKDPVFLPVQKPIKNMKSAKMTVVRGSEQSVEEIEDPAFNFQAPLFNSYRSEGSLQNGFTQILQRDKLTHLLNIACRSFSKICCNNRYSYKSLYNAAQNGEVEKLLKVIASGLNPNHIFEEYSNQTALHVAAKNGHLPAVHILLQAKSQINVFDGEQNTPLTAAISAKHNDVVKYLIKCGADLNLKGEDGMTPLHIAAKSGNVGACYHLLNGTYLPTRYIDSLDDGGWTPMVWASEFNHLEVVRFLISKGADPLIKDAEQNVALHWAAFGGSIDIVELFLNDGSEINAVNVHGDTPLHIAARQHKYGCVLLLLARGARSDLKNKNGEQPRDCCDSPASDIYKGLTLNMEISSLLTRFQDRSPKIMSNDISRGKERNQIQCVNCVDDEGEPNDFVYVSESCFTSKIIVDRTITSLQSCKCRDVCSSENCTCGGISIKCWYDSDGRLKPDFNYVDPPPIFECNQACSCNRITCKNRVVQNGITCRFQLFKTEGRGWGIRTLNMILKGTFVCEYIGEIISDWEADHREDDSYLFDLENRDGETYCIDARYYGNIARFINHMCVPNVIPVHIFVDHQDLRFPRIAFFANRDIFPNEELGYNYGDKFWVIKWKTFTCICGSEKCLYSENTIKTTLDNYQKKLSEENS